MTEGLAPAGKEAKFVNLRHTGASHITQRGRDSRNLLAVVKMIIPFWAFAFRDLDLEGLALSPARVERPASRNFAPTVLRLMGVAVPSFMAGRPLW